MKNCLTCGGAIMEPNKAYQYAGPVCHCIVPPRIQKTSDMSEIKIHDFIFENGKLKELGKDLTYKLQELTQERDRYKAALEKCKEQRDWYISEKYEGEDEKEIENLTERENRRLDAILEQEQEGEL